MKIVIPGDPIPKARARINHKGWAYDPQHVAKENVRKYLKTEFYKKYENRNEDGLLDDGEAFEVNWHFHMPIPKSFSQFKKNACKWGFIEHTSKPDRSNLEKFYEDCANGILWHDDSQIVRGQIVKKYCDDDKPRTEIYMIKIKEHAEDVKNIVSLFSPAEISDICMEANKIDMELESVKLHQISRFISKLADLHATKLTKITKKYHNHWKKLDSKEKFI